MYEASIKFNHDLENFRILNALKNIGYKVLVNLDGSEATMTICHGNLDFQKSFFFKYEEDKPVDVKVIGWNKMHYCSIIDDLVDILGDIMNDDDLKKYLTIYIEAMK